MATFGKIGAGTLLNHRKFARDYVQDGLVAMWDAIENAGWGQHDNKAKVWKELIGSFPVKANIPSTVTWSDRGLQNNGSSEIRLFDESVSKNALAWYQSIGLVNSSRIFINNYTIEIVFKTTTPVLNSHVGFIIADSPSYFYNSTGKKGATLQGGHMNCQEIFSRNCKYMKKITRNG